MSENNQMMSVEGQLVGMPLAGPESFSQQQLNYLKRALGMDETLLYENSEGIGWNSNTINLSETWFNFERVRFYYRPWSNVDAIKCPEFVPNGNSPYMCTLIDAFTDSWQWAADSTPYMNIVSFHTNSEGTIITLDRQRFLHIGGAWETKNQGKLYKVVGIHRIAGGNNT